MDLDKHTKNLLKNKNTILIFNVTSVQVVKLVHTDLGSSSHE